MISGLVFAFGCAIAGHRLIGGMHAGVIGLALNFLIVVVLSLRVKPSSGT